MTFPAAVFSRRKGHIHLGGRATLAALAVFLFATGTSAAAPSVTAILDNSETFVGQPVQLGIKVSGATGATPPGMIAVDGLDIRYSGQSQLVEGRNFQFSYSSVYNYTVMPLKAGTFTIPPQSVRVGGSSLQTPALTLNVAASTGRSARTNRRSDTVDPNKIGFAELILPKSTAYAGEIIPAVVRILINARVPIESLGQGIQIAGQGFTRNSSEPKESIEEIDGQSYHVFTLKTAISPARPGKIEIGPAEITPLVRIARPDPRRQALPKDVFDMDDPFFNSFFNDPAFQPSIRQEVTIKSQPHTIEVKPLPPNAPPNFAGAIGNFTLKAEAKPKSAQVGDPITTTATVSGRGNFDRVTAPEFEDDRGWHKYPPAANFTKDDDVGISGTKIFETVLSANEPKHNVPPLIFSYFDPVKESYVTLRSDPLQVRVEGNAAAPAATPAPSLAAAPRAGASAASPPSAAKQNDILGPLSEPASTVSTFAPFYRRSSFWLAQLLPLLGLGGYVAWKVRKVRLADHAAQRAASLREQIAELQRKLRRDDLPPDQYVADATRAIQLKTALAANVQPDAVDPATATNVFGADDLTRSRLERLFQQRDELRYSGSAGNGAGQLSDDNRRELLELVETLHA